MSIRIEFYGVVRRRTEVESVEVDMVHDSAPLSDVLGELRLRFPALAEHCFDGDRLRRGYTANVNGQRFVSDPATLLHRGDALLLMSNDAGG
ncbi:MAG: MoaD/ThiS family protein [Pirellulaceae bacterium]